MSINAITQQLQPLLVLGSVKNKLLLTHGVTETYINQRSSPFAKCLRHTGKTVRERKPNIFVFKDTFFLATKKKKIRAGM